MALGFHISPNLLYSLWGITPWQSKKHYLCYRAIFLLKIPVMFTILTGVIPKRPSKEHNGLKMA
jgi:hypothetical protein